MDYEFDFGSGMPLPPPPNHTRELAPTSVASRGSHGRPFRSFTYCADAELIDYLHNRRVSPLFLEEIDNFLSAHPDIATYKPDWTYEINHSRPLDAYLFFVKGYTRPARYGERFLPDVEDIPLFFDHEPLIKRHDPEMIEFFYRYEYRYDILEYIDRQVTDLVQQLYNGRQVSLPQRKLVVLALYGNLVDVFKFYEYNYQTEWLPHRYVFEHIILTELPHHGGQTQPAAHQVTQPDETCRENARSHRSTRFRMARACDAGASVIDILLEDFAATLCRRGFRRNDIESLRKEAQFNIDHQRAIGGGRDLVDMVMNKALTVNGPSQAVKPEEKGSKKDRVQQRRAKTVEFQTHTLRRLYDQEAAAQDFPSVRDAVKAARERVERMLVTDLTEMAFQAGTMSRQEMDQWRDAFTKKKARLREQKGETLDFFEVFAKLL